MNQCDTLNAMGGPCAVGVTLSADATREAVEAAFANPRNLYFFYAAENKDKYRDLWRRELGAQEVMGPSSSGKFPPSAFVHIFDEAHVAVTWHNFRTSFKDFRDFFAGMPLHQLVGCLYSYFAVHVFARSSDCAACHFLSFPFLPFPSLSFPFLFFFSFFSFSSDSPLPTARFVSYASQILRRVHHAGLFLDYPA